MPLAGRLVISAQQFALPIWRHTRECCSPRRPVIASDSCMNSGFRRLKRLRRVMIERGLCYSQQRCRGYHAVGSVNQSPSTARLRHVEAGSRIRRSASADEGSAGRSTLRLCVSFLACRPCAREGSSASCGRRDVRHEVGLNSTIRKLRDALATSRTPPSSRRCHGMGIAFVNR